MMVLEAGKRFFSTHSSESLVQWSSNKVAGSDDLSWWSWVCGKGKKKKKREKQKKLQKRLAAGSRAEE